MEINQSLGYLMSKLVDIWEREVLVAPAVFADILSVDVLHEGKEQTSISYTIVFEPNDIRMAKLAQRIELINDGLRANALLEYLGSKHGTWLECMDCLEHLGESTFTNFLVKRDFAVNLITAFQFTPGYC